MNWKLKGLIQKSLSILPCGSSCNHFLQKKVGLLRSDAFVGHVFEEDITVLLERMARIHADPSVCRVLEIGTGWLPVFPLCLALAGFRHITSVDLYPHLRPAAVRQTLLALLPYLDHPAFRPFATPGLIHKNYERFLSGEDILKEARITYQAPCNASAMRMEGSSLDLIVSNNVFEHVPVPMLIELFAEARRLLCRGGHVIHCVNCGDHYAYADGSITQLNYLRFSEADWSPWNNSLQFQNRLRPIDFMELAESTGMQITSTEFEPSLINLEQLRAMVIAPDFRHYSLDQLASTSLTLIASVH